MLYERHELPSLDGSVILECYIPQVTAAIDPLVQRPAVVICPGGGYHHLSPREAEPVALRFNAAGINAYVVSYRLGDVCAWPAPLMDLAAAMAWVRAHTAEHHTHPAKIAVMGFSAGAHLVASLGVHWPEAQRWSPLDITPQDVRPDAMLLCYPVISSGACAHRGSFNNITHSDDPAVHLPLSVEPCVGPHTPPTFLWHTWDDPVVPVENTLLMTSALRRAGVSAELHIYQHGEHGLSLCDHTSALHDHPGHIEPDNAGWFQLAVRFMQRL